MTTLPFGRDFLIIRGEKMFLLDKNEELTTALITKIIQTFETSEKPKLQKYYDYYNGKQLITYKTVTDTTKPCNRITTNYCYNITNNFLGYLTGKAVTYSSQQDITDIQAILNYNDVKSADSELLKNALIYGKAYEINYIDEDAEQRFKVLDSREVIPVYDNTLNQNLMYVIRYYPADTLDYTKGYYVEVYTKNEIYTYQTNTMFSSLGLQLIVPHYYGQVPVTVFSLNTEEQSIFDKIMTLQDAYNTLLSSEVDDFEAFCDAYLVLTNVTAEAEDIQSMKENRVLLLGEGASAEYLNKDIKDTQIENMLANIDKKIHLIGNYPDFSDDAFGTSSGIAMKMKLLGMENTASAIIGNMTKALQKRIELIATILNVKGSEAMWRDIDIIFTRNIPVDEAAIASEINTLRGLVSDKTLLAQLPFVDDVQAELDEVNKQKSENMQLYAFSNQQATTPMNSGDNSVN